MIISAENKPFILRRELVYCLLSGIISLIAAYYFLGLYNVDIRVPFVYAGDTYSGLIIAQNFVTGNGRFLLPNMGAPGIVSLASMPDGSHIEYLGMWFLSIFFNEAGIVVNVFYVLTFFAVSFATALSLRLLRINPLLSIMGGVLYALLPYHFYRGVSHLFLSAYATIPLACVVIIWIMNGELKIRNPNSGNGAWPLSFVNSINRKFIFAVIVAVYSGLTGIYYTFFICLGIGFAIIWNFIEERKLKNVTAPAIVLSLIALTVVVSLIPYIVFSSGGGASFLDGTRMYRDVELYALRISQLILPVLFHRIPLLSRARMFYENNVSVTHLTESFASTLGLFMSIGFLLSLIIAMVRKSKLVQENQSLKNSAIVNLFILLVGIMGGFSAIIGIFIPSVRTYNRISLMIAFFSIFIVLFIIEKGLERLPVKRIFRAVIIILIGVLAVFDMVGTNSKVGRHFDDMFYNRHDFIMEVEEVTTAGSMVFQLPFIPSSSHTHFVDIGVYEHFIPFVHSTSLRWSYRAQVGSTAERWQALVSRLYTEDMLRHLAGVGFAGIYINTDGYIENEREMIVSEIMTHTGVSPIFSRDGRLVYFHLEDFFHGLRNIFNEAESVFYSDWEGFANRNVPLITINSFHTINGTRDGRSLVSNGHAGHLLFGPYDEIAEGFYIFSADIELLNYDDAPDEICAFDISYNSGQGLLGFSNINKHDLTDGGLTIEIPVHVRYYITDFEFRLFTFDGVVLRVSNPSVKVSS